MKGIIREKVLVTSRHEENSLAKQNRKCSSNSSAIPGGPVKISAHKVEPKCHRCHDTTVGRGGGKRWGAGAAAAEKGQG